MVFHQLSDLFRRYVRLFFGFGTIIGLVFFFRFVGWKGMMAFFLGMLIMAYLLLSKNVMLQVVLRMFEGSDEYIDELNKKSGVERR